MDIVTPVIIAAISKLGETVIKDSYDKLKSTIAKKFGRTSDLVETIEKLEQKPDSAGRKETLREEIVAAKADQDGEIVRAAEALMEKLKSLPGGQQVVQQTVTGNENIFSGTGDVTIHKDKVK